MLTTQVLHWLWFGKSIETTKRFNHADISKALMHFRAEDGASRLYMLTKHWQNAGYAASWIADVKGAT